MSVTSTSDLNEKEHEILDFLRTRGWDISIYPYLEDDFGEMTVMTPDKIEDNFNGDEEIRTFFRAIDLFLR